MLCTPSLLELQQKKKLINISNVGQGLKARHDETGL